MRRQSEGKIGCSFQAPLLALELQTLASGSAPDRSTATSSLTLERAPKSFSFRWLTSEAWSS